MGLRDWGAGQGWWGLGVPRGKCHSGGLMLGLMLMNQE